MPENESESTGHDRDCSLNSCESFAWFDRDSWSWKTSQRCLVEGWATYSESFPRAGTMRNGIAYRRQASAPLTGGTGCLSSESWITPSVEDCKPAGPVEVSMMRTYESGTNVPDTYKRLRSQAAARMWPTPTKEDSRGGASTTPGGARATGLNATVRNWPTPKAQASRCAKYDRGKSNLGEEVYASVPEATAAGGSLNPTWVEWLMGFPPEWTALSASETPSSRKSRKSSGGESGS